MGEWRLAGPRFGAAVRRSALSLLRAACTVSCMTCPNVSYQPVQSQVLVAAQDPHAVAPSVVAVLLRRVAEPLAPRRDDATIPL
jgi:hypothetical protein